MCVLKKGKTKALSEASQSKVARRNIPRVMGDKSWGQGEEKGNQTATFTRLPSTAAPLHNRKQMLKKRIASILSKAANDS